jgi:cell division protein FtsI (penicillin-binding protein 3)
VQKQKAYILTRAAVVYILTALIGIGIIYMVIRIQFVEGEYWKSQEKKSQFIWEEVAAIRGNICADDGSFLMTSVPYFDIYMDAALKNISDQKFNQQIGPLADSLSRLFKDRSRRSYLRYLKNARTNGKHYLLIQRDVNFHQLQKIYSFPLLKEGQFMGGLIVNPKTKRIKPFKSLAYRTIGYVNSKAEHPEFVGIEGAFDTELKGSNGKRLMQKIANGYFIPVNQDNQIEPRNGKDIATSIDIHIQDVAESSLRRQLQQYDADFGTAIVMEVHTGYLKAIANLGKTESGKYVENFNYAIGRLMPLGSVMKAASYLAALEDKVFPGLDFIVDAGKGRKKYADLTMTDAHRGGFGKISAREAFVKSSNIGVSTIIDGAYDSPDDFIKTLKQFHLNQKTGIEIYGEPAPEIRQPGDKYWSEATSLPYLSIGYESRFTPLQMLTFYNAIANDGRMMRPRLVTAIKESGETIRYFPPETVDPNIAKSKNINIIKELLQEVVENGTASNLNNTAFTIAGKTGTSQIAQRNTGYNKENYAATFVGYFPAENPVFSIIVAISNPKKEQYYGNIVAGTVFEEIANKLYATHTDIYSPVITRHNTMQPPVAVIGKKNRLPQLYQQLGYPSENIQTSHDWIVSIDYTDTVRFGPRIFNKNIMPDLRGMNIRDAVFILEEMGLKTRFFGKGKISRQSVAPGTKINQGITVNLYLS